MKHFLDTPGFENENQTKPEETKIISGGGGLAKPEDMADTILTDSLVKKIDSMQLKQNLIKIFYFFF